MGKRKSAAKPPPKKRIDKLDTVFSCPFCNHGSSVECRIDMKNLIGEASCRICQENFSTTVNGTPHIPIELQNRSLSLLIYTVNGLTSVSVSTLLKVMMMREDALTDEMDIVMCRHLEMP
ncbi:hypothetical protein PR202_gb17863 [Eleusine coracana subsp. coracana]|uniref:Transcription elongation factor 1 homolog n=1 Tax=Eleusine coracana subsp. coracana TaxID=191504 RepID=A0AAV5F5G8_ELECO|nr:hypothetical protein PR202_gb17863 [Eleusine coracana subsp. coracana]